MKFYKEVLSSSQSRLLTRLAPFLSDRGFYLAGGTAIALMIGHRKSVDLDWFSPTRIGDPALWADKIKAVGLNPMAVNVDKGTFYATIGRVPISILEFPYAMVNRFVQWKTVGCNLASLDDLACMKLSAIASRGSKKDFIDIHALMQKHKTLRQMLSLYKKKFPEADLFPVLRGLSYFDDADKERMPRMLWKLSWDAIKKEVMKELGAYLKNIEH